MKSLTNLLRYVPVGIIAIVTFLIWQRHQHSATWTPVPAGGISTNATMAAKAPDYSPVVVQPAQPRPEAPILSPSPTNGALALIHLKFREWLESKTGDTETQDRLLKEFLAMLTDENAAEITQSLSPDELDTPLGTVALERWLKADLATAANWIAGKTNATEEQVWLVGRKMLEDPAGVQNLLNYSDQLTNNPWKQQLFEGAGLLLSETNPAAAINLAQRMDAGQSQTNLLQTATYDWISRDPNAALDWILSVNDPSLREKLIAIGSQAYAATDPRLAADWLVSTVKSDETLNDAVVHVVDAWTTKNPAEAAQWVSALPAGPMRDAAIYTVVSQWLPSDRGGNGPAGAWILNLPEEDRNKILLKLGSVPETPVDDPSP